MAIRAKSRSIPACRRRRRCRGRYLAAGWRSQHRIWRRWPSCSRPKPILTARAGFLLSWGILNFFWIALLRRPALSGALSLTLVVVLVLLSRLKHDIAQMTANFVDLMVIDRDTAAFLFTIFPNLRWSVMSAGVVTAPLMYALWWLDPFRIRRLPASAGMLGCLAGAGRIFLHLAGRSLARLLRRRLPVEIFPLRRQRGVGFHQLRLHGIRCGRDRASQRAAIGFLPSRRAAAEHHHDP